MVNSTQGKQGFKQKLINKSSKNDEKTTSHSQNTNSLKTENQIKPNQMSLEKQTNHLRY